MATCIISLSSLLAMAVVLISSLAASEDDIVSSRNQDLAVATEEMQTANYFTFVMLINMEPASLIQGNVTFLMPNDRTLAKTLMPENAVVDFLLRHTIPSPLLIDHLLHLPTNSIIPTAEPGFALKVSNHGRKSFYLNNVRITSPNICTAGSSIRCHGIDGVVQHATVTVTPPHDNSTSHTIRSSPPPAPPSPRWPPPQPGGVNLAPSGAPPPAGHNASPQKSGSSKLLPLGGKSLEFIQDGLSNVLNHGITMHRASELYHGQVMIWLISIFL
ncbi:FAS1 domain-containing protein SELMODRAFT_448915-like [Diospyros lotus]|uniref:FAS1 domain-containing protein SELMODRAFT_448915-like n=1 Tax=Diospyros lotus TaxID=55363 RepID=UPI002252F6BE|nr:FAS1 domain-containing protein SELMODRAFT_448915-like [Diospyros lotus]